jgi:hypothetical protein
MSVHDKTHPTLGPTEEAQDVDRLARQIVPMPAFNDPNNPVAASGSVNLSLNDHPVQHPATTVRASRRSSASIMSRTRCPRVLAPFRSST